LQARQQRACVLSRANVAGVTSPRSGGNTRTRTGLSDERRARRASSISISVARHVLQHGSSARALSRANAAGVTLPRSGGNTRTRTGLLDERRARRASSISGSESYIAGTAAARLCALACYNVAGVTSPRSGGNIRTRTGLSDERRARRASSISSRESYIAGTAAARLCALACQCSWCNVAAFGRKHTHTHWFVG